MSQIFTVKCKDKASGKEVTLGVSANSVIDTQAKAEAHIGGLPGSVGGTHPGFEVIPAKAPDAVATTPENKADE